MLVRFFMMCLDSALCGFKFCFVFFLPANTLSKGRAGWSASRSHAYGFGFEKKIIVIYSSNFIFTYTFQLILFFFIFSLCLFTYFLPRLRKSFGELVPLGWTRGGRACAAQNSITQHEGRFISRVYVLRLASPHLRGTLLVLRITSHHGRTRRPARL